MEKMMSGFDLSDYNDVPSRIAEFREKHPEGTLQSEVVPSPIDGFVIVKGYAYRDADDPRPGIGLAWEPVPGRTPYTKDSELQNAETSAWGRAIVAVGAADAKKGVANQEDIRNRQAEPELTLEQITEKLQNRLKTKAAQLTDGDVNAAKELYEKFLPEQLTRENVETTEQAMTDYVKEDAA